MSTLIKKVFHVMAIVLVSLLLFNAIYGQAGRETMWGAMYRAYISYWNSLTWNEGDTVSILLNDMFYNTGDLTTE